ncbi:MAG TPA: glycosyltransferase family 39 protein [Puia sp.]
MFKRKPIILLFLTVIGALLHFYNVNWGAPFYFHPDERNIASAVTQLSFPDQMNPHFFAYGSLPIYAIYFTSVGANYLMQLLQMSTSSQLFTVTFEQAIVVGRIFSALLTTFLIPLLFVLGKKLKDEKTGLWAAFFATASVGFTQFSHFGTFEMWLTFFGTLLFLLCLKYFSKPSTLTLIFLSLIIGILVSIKVTSLELVPIPILLFAWHSFQKTSRNQSVNKFRLSEILKLRTSDVLIFLKKTVLFIFISGLIYILTNPYVLLDQKDFLSSMNYESSVAIGTEPVFYTQNFDNTVPVVYQFLHVYPFLLNPLLIILFIPAFIYLLWQMVKTKNPFSLLLVTFYLILFLSQVFLFVKWTRYMIPTMPFIYLIISLALPNNKTMKQFNNISIKPIRGFLTNTVIVICIIFAFAYFKTAFINDDSRIDAALFAQHAIPVDANILSEPSDLGVLPFQDAFPHFTTFSFYDLDNNSSDATEEQLQQALSTAQYIVLPSQRVLQSRIKNPTLFPKSYVFYKSLLNGSLGFKKIYETPCDIFCKITYLGDPTYWWEQTVSVFDRPTVFIFKKTT